MMEKRSTRNTPQMEKSQLNCMWGLISSLYFGQNQRKQKLLSNGKVATKNFIVVQPCVGIWSDKCHSKYGRRRPFIFIGAVMISIAHCRHSSRAAIIFVIGFWMLDLANNTVQGSARALLADLSGPAQRNTANAVFCSWMTVGNFLGFSAGASGGWHSVYKGEPEKILQVKKAEAEAESKYLGGVGVARQRQAITDGLRENILNFSHKVDDIIYWCIKS
ncbi:hypothetical protein P3S68_011222 [Capsicum galapagoense]